MARLVEESGSPAMRLLIATHKEEDALNVYRVSLDYNKKVAGN